MVSLRHARSGIFGYGYVDDSHHRWLKENIPIVFDHYLRLYMHHMREFDVDATNRDTFLSRRVSDQLCNNLRYMHSRYGSPRPSQPFVWKYRYHGYGEPDDLLTFQDQEHAYTTYIEVTKLEQQGSHGFLSEGMITIFDIYGSKSTLFQLQFNRKKLIKCVSILGTPMMNMDHQNREKNHLKNLTAGGFPDDVKMRLEFGLYLVRHDSLHPSEEDPVNIHHENYEVMAFQRAMRMAQYDNFTATSVVSYCYQERTLEDDVHSGTFELPLYVSDYFGQFPLVDITPREMKSIQNYLKERNLCIGTGQTIDLLAYLKEPAYGKELRLPITEQEVLFDYLIWEDRDFIRFVIGFRQGDVIPFVTIDCNHLHNFSIKESLIRVSSNVSFIGRQDLLPDLKDLNALIPFELKDVVSVINILANAIDIYVIGKNRPNRIKITKVSRLKSGLAPHSPTYVPEEKDYVITRIMRTVRRTKELCEELSREQHRDSPVQYVVESWNRIGHWRTTASGTKVWIKPTVCKRHQELTTKEVHIKLE